MPSFKGITILPDRQGPKRSPAELDKEFGSLGENSDSSLLREIDEELRQEHYSKLWSQYGKYLIAAAVLLVASVAGYKGWQSYDMSNRSELAERFSLAVGDELNGNLDAAHQAFSALGSDASGGFEMLARFRAASTLSQQGDLAGAAGIYESLSGDSSIDQQYRDIALLLGVMNELDSADPADIVSRLAALTADDNPWRFSARELSALAAIRNGDRQKASELYTQIASDNSAPATMRSRAQEILDALGAP